MLEIKAETLTAPIMQVFDNSGCCEDCPDINPNPPSDSDCPYFDIRGGEPVCTRPTEFQRQIGGGSGAGTGIEDFSLLKMLEKY